MKKKQTTDYVKAARRGSREAELEMHGHPLPRHKVHASKKTYHRAKAKAGRKDRPFSWNYNFHSRQNACNSPKNGRNSTQSSPSWTARYSTARSAEMSIRP